MTTTGTERRHLGKPTNLEGQAPGVKAANGRVSLAKFREVRRVRWGGSYRLIHADARAVGFANTGFLEQQMPWRGAGCRAIRWEGAPNFLVSMLQRLPPVASLIVSQVPSLGCA